MNPLTFEQLRAVNDALLDAVEASPDEDKLRSSVIDREAAQVVLTFKGDPVSWRRVARDLAPEGAFRVELLPDHVDVYGEG